MPPHWPHPATVMVFAGDVVEDDDVVLVILREDEEVELELEELDVVVTLVELGRVEVGGVDVVDVVVVLLDEIDELEVDVLELEELVVVTLPELEELEELELELEEPDVVTLLELEAVDGTGVEEEVVALLEVVGVGVADVAANLHYVVNGFDVAAGLHCE
ncbi:hypothetical protein TWF191_000110 [Orbilia oligospora]|uniref:Uncharacterized protein n=1 Tax=Orbilia oligospora TaxID=2813651 RepID=A0A7C8VA16_ORBOL|nr:hypothetical protein TWF191_000110 [Orbilia oligospora]